MQPNRPHGAAAMKGRRANHRRRVSPTSRVQSPLQGTLKTRYFSVYLAYMRVSRFCKTVWGRLRSLVVYARELSLQSRLRSFDVHGRRTPLRFVSDVPGRNCKHRSAPPDRASRHRRHGRAPDTCGFSGGLCPGGVFSPAFLVKRGHFSLKKWKRMAYYFNLVF